MPKAKLYRNQRLTRKSLKHKHRKEDGRPKGTNKRFKFEETRLGFMLKYEVPVVYDIIMNMMPKSVSPEPPILLIKLICENSNDPSLKKAKFTRYLKLYEELGLYCKRARILTPKRKAYYEGIRQKKLDKFIVMNRDKIERMKKNI